MQSMTATEVRDRLGDRFRLLVGSRRGLERHQTLRHAVAWSYDLLDDGERSVLDRCSVFAGGFDLAGARAVTGSDDDFAMLDLLDALVRKSLLVADQSSGRTRFSMLETIRQFAEEQLAAMGEATEARTAHARYFAQRETDIMSLWDSPRQREAYDWFTTERANLRTAFRWVADRGDLDDAATIATYAAFLGFCIENYEPVAWAEELIETARAVGHRRLVFLYVMASQCYMAGRFDEAVRYSELGQQALATGCDELPFGSHALLGGAYLAVGKPERWAQLCRDVLARRSEAPVIISASLVLALAIAGRAPEAISAAKDLENIAEATGNPYLDAFSLFAYGFAFHDADPARALHALRRGQLIAQDSGNRLVESLIAMNLARLEAEQGDGLAALNYITVAIRNYHDSGNISTLRSPLAILAAYFDRLGRYRPAASIAGFAMRPTYGHGVPRDQHRDHPSARGSR
jgi:tetratricopeptide (TPR) repeat protein